MIVKENIARDAVRLLIWYPVRWLVAALPPRVGLIFFRFMGDLDHAFSRGKRRAITRILRNALGVRTDDPRISAAVREYFRNHYVNQLQIFLFPRLTRSTIGQIHKFTGLEHLDAALRRGNGCILVHAHFGPSQLPLCALGIFGYPTMQLGYLTDEGLSFIGKRVAFRLRKIYEDKIPARIISADTFLRPVMEWIRKNKVLMITGDGAGGGKFIGKYRSYPFLGEPTLFPLGAMRLAVKSGAAVLPLFTVLDEDGTYTTVIHEPIDGSPDIAGNRSPETLAEVFVNMLEGYVVRYPHLWHFWEELTIRRAGRQNES
jgi:KDO2-lipid IV(A) lauroyltransferase